jgi:hypothetical protein
VYQIQSFVTLPLAPPGSIGSPIVPIGEGLSNLTVGNPPNANSVVGAVSVTTADGRPYPGQIILGGTDGAKFVLSNGGFLPCNLLVGSVDVAAGTYSINLTAN